MTTPQPPYVAYVHEPSPYVYNRLLDSFEKRKALGWTIITDLKKDENSFQFQWDEYENIDWDRVLKGDLMCNSYCFRKGLTRKVQLSKFLEQYNAKNPNSLLRQSTPQTWTLEIPATTYEYGNGDEEEEEDEDEDEDDEDAEYAREMAIEDVLVDVEQLFEQAKAGYAHPIWILKPSLGNKGGEIVVVNDYETVKSTVIKWKDVCEWVLQQYIENPLLVYGGKKFHLRVYAVAVGALQVYVNENILALISMENYSKDNLEERFVHLTNTSVQYDHPDFNEDSSVKLLSELSKEGEITKEQEDTIFEKVKVNVREIFRAVERQSSAFLALPNCFELFGFDFLVDENLNVWILEVNCGPDMKNTGSRLDFVISDLLESTLQVTVDPYIKKMKGEDTSDFLPTPEQLEEISKNSTTLAKKGTLHLVHNAKIPNWGRPNISFRE